MSLVNKFLNYCFLLFLSSFFLFLGGCFSLPREKENYKFFYLKTTPFSEKERASLPSVEWQLILEEPSCDGRLNTDKIIVQEASAELTHVTGARWVDRLPNLIQQLLLNLFENSQKIEGLGTPLDGIEADYVLLIDIRDFELIVEETKYVKVRLFAKLMRLRDREIIGARTFEKIVPLEQASFKEVIQAFLDATNNVGKDLVRWSLERPQISPENIPNIPPLRKKALDLQ